MPIETLPSDYLRFDTALTNNSYTRFSIPEPEFVEASASKPNTQLKSILRSSNRSKGSHLSSGSESSSVSISLEGLEDMKANSKRTLTTFTSDNSNLSYASPSNSGRAIGLVEEEVEEDMNMNSNANGYGYADPDPEPEPDTKFSNHKEANYGRKMVTRTSSARSNSVNGSVPRRTLFDIDEQNVSNHFVDRAYDTAKAEHDKTLVQHPHGERDVELLERVADLPDYFADGSSALVSSSSPTRTSSNSNTNSKSNSSGRKKRISTPTKFARESSKLTKDDPNRKSTRIKIKSDDNHDAKKGKKKLKRLKKKKRSLPDVMMRPTASSKLRDKEFKKEQNRLEALKEEERKKPKLKLFINPKPNDIRIAKGTTTDGLLLEKKASRKDGLSKTVTRRSPILGRELDRRTMKDRSNIKVTSKSATSRSPIPLAKRSGRSKIKLTKSETSLKIKKIEKKNLDSEKEKRGDTRRRRDVTRSKHNKAKVEKSNRGEKKLDATRSKTIKNEKGNRLRSDEVVGKAKHSKTLQRESDRGKNISHKGKRKEKMVFRSKNESEDLVRHGTNIIGGEKIEEAPVLDTSRQERKSQEILRTGSIPAYISDDNNDYISVLSQSIRFGSSHRSVISTQLELSSWEEMYEYLCEVEKNPEKLLVNLLRGGSEAFHTIAWKSPPQIAKKFYSLLAPEEYVMLRSVDVDGNTPLHLCCANLSPNEEDVDLSTLKALLERVPECLEEQNNEKDSPLHLFLSSPLASRYTNANKNLDYLAVEALELILDLMPSNECLFLQDSSGAVPLHTAIANEACETILELLVDIAPDQCKIEDSSGMIPLHYAAAFKRTPVTIVERLIEEYKFSICHKTRDGDTPLHLLICNSTGATKHNFDLEFEEQTFETVKLLMGAETIGDEEDFNKEYYPLLIQNSEKLTPLHCFVLFANVPHEIGEQLMNHPSAAKALTMTNAYGATPMHISVAHTQISFDAIELLATPDSIVAQDSLGRNALHIAAQNVNISAQVIKFLVETNPLACNKESDGGYIPMHLAVHSKAAIEVVQELYESYPSSLERDIILGDLPLHRAATNNAPINVIKFLLKEFIGAIYKQNQLGNLPLHCAVSSGASQKVIKELVQAWPESVTTQNSTGSSPLHILVKLNGSIHMIDLFLKSAPSSVIILDVNGRSPLDLATVTNSRKDVINLLRNAAEEWTKKALDDGWSNFEETR